jgi:ribosomal protein S18 acetylase RimI-like enzyme
MMWEIQTVQLSQEVIFSYFDSNHNIFVPPLSDRVNLKEYSGKLATFSTHFCVFSGINMVGFAACYFNHPYKETSFLSTFSVVKEFQNRGIGSELLRAVINYGTLKGFDELRLNVFATNKDAFDLYSRSGFVETVRRQGKSEMVLRLKK